MLSKLVEDVIECNATIGVALLLLLTGLRSMRSGRCWYNPVVFVGVLVGFVIGLRLVLTSGTETTKLVCGP